MALPVAQCWFERRTIDDAVTLLWEPHVDPWMRCNIWHVRGRERDLLVDSGFGVASLAICAMSIGCFRLAVGYDARSPWSLADAPGDEAAAADATRRSADTRALWRRVALDGGLIFAGDDQGFLTALDAESGEALWHFNNGARVSASPITYAVKGKQFVAVAAGGNVVAFALTGDDDTGR